MPNSAGWKVWDDIVWIANATATGTPINGFWKEKFGTLMWTREGEPRLVKVSEDLQHGIGTLWEHMEERIVVVRGGTAPRQPPQMDRADASYIWKVFRKQAYNLKKAGQKELNSSTALPQLRDMLEEIKSGTKVCSKARREAREKMAEKGNGTSKGKGKVVPREGGQGSGLEYEMDLPTVVRQLNAGVGLQTEDLSDELKHALHLLHEDLRRCSADGEQIALDVTKYPDLGPIEAFDVQGPRYSVQPMEMFYEQISSMSKSTKGGRKNRLDEYRLSQPGEVQATHVGIGKKRAREQQSTPGGNEGSPEHKRPRPNNSDECMEDVVASSSGDIYPPWRGEELQRLCSDPWNAYAVLLCAFFEGDEPPEEIMSAVNQGLFWVCDAVSKPGVGAGRMGKEYVDTLTDTDTAVGAYFG